MKKIILFAFLILLTALANAQIKVNDLIGELPLNSRLDSIEFNKILKREFSSVINSSGKTTIGNYASADIKDGRLTFNATKNFTNGDMLSLNASGVITDGFFAIFNQTKVNSNVGINIKYNVRLNSSSISYYNDEITALRNKIYTSYAELKINKSIHRHDSLFLQKKSALIATEINNINSKLKNVNLNTEQRTSLEYQLALKILQQDSISLKLQTLISVNETDEESKLQYEKAKNTALVNFKYTKIFFQWISFGGGFQNNNFNQFKPNFSMLEDQISKQNNLVWNATVEYNLYKWSHRSKLTYYLLCGVRGMVDDNFSDLSKVEINDSNTYGTSTKQRTTTQKFNAYQGDYKTKLLSVKFYVDYYRFFFNNDAAIHIYPEVYFKKNEKPLYNNGIGLLYSFIDSKDKVNKTKLNAELYFKLNDLSNNEKSNLALFQRNELGLRLSIPVSFFNF